MSDTSSELESLDIDLSSVLDQDTLLQGFSFEPRREDFPELWDNEWGDENPHTTDSDESTSSGADHGNRRGTTEWCQCSYCESMPTETECQCCIELQAVYKRVSEEERDICCVTEHTKYAVVTNITVLENTLWLIHHTRNDPINFEDPRSLRWAAFKQFTAWIYGKLGKRVRRVIPSCVVNNIRQRHPNPPGVDYIGFIDVTMQNDDVQ